YSIQQKKKKYNITEQDKNLQAYLSKQMVPILEEMGAKDVAARGPIEDYNIVPYQTTHNTGGTVMGADPETSVVNNYLQHWDMDNLFVVGAGNFAHNGGYNPTGTVGALAYRCAEGIIKYSKKGGSLV